MALKYQKKKEQARLQTFLECWSDATRSIACALATYGYLYESSSGNIKCAFCGHTEVYNPSSETKVTCPPGARGPCTKAGNIPMTDELRSEMIQSRTKIEFDADPGAANLPGAGAANLPGPIQVMGYIVEHPVRATVEDRKITFADLAQGTYKVSVVNLVSAGFFYQEETDQVTCFHCSGSLPQWRDLIPEDPWKQHARCFPGCPFLMEKKGAKFIRLQRSQMTEDELQRAAALPYKPGDLAFLKE